MKKLLELDPKIHTNKIDFIKEPVIIRLRDIDEDYTGEFAKKISEAHQTGQPVIPIIVDSFGGDPYAVLSMVSEIENSDIPIATIVDGKAMSAGAIIFSFGAEGHRYMSPRASIMIHDTSAGIYGKSEEIEANAKEVKRLTKKLYSMMSINCGHNKDYFEKLVFGKGRVDWYLGAREAIRHNLANHLRIPKLVTKVSVDIEFG